MPHLRGASMFKRVIPRFDKIARKKCRRLCMIARIPWARGNALPVRSGLQELRISQGQGSRFILRSELQEFILSFLT